MHFSQNWLLLKNGSYSKRKLNLGPRGLCSMHIGINEFIFRCMNFCDAFTMFTVILLLMLVYCC